ncbi:MULTISPECIES: hypothetical protein [unclassified Brevundimonas]|uniref:hypothetical protein n=1 Tax=unclassified Brevundimonas TaxID=2622653 RepID=UPI0025B93470|nr:MULTISPECIES: hypothetical protein [unclassified Brevundimonas]
MNPQARRNWLKMKTRQLIAECGGLEEAAAACKEECRPYSVQQLSRCQNPRAADMLPLDIQDCLEAYCGRPVISQALTVARPHTGTVGELRDESSEVTETAALLQRRIRESLANDGEIDPVEAAHLMDVVREGMGHLADVEASLKPLLKRGA